MIQARNITYCYGRKQVLRNINLHVKKGENLVLFGADEAGKTTLLHCIMGFQKNYEGELVLFGGTVRQMTKQMYQRIRFVPDDIIREPHMTAGQYLKWASGRSAAYNHTLEGELCAKWEPELQEQLMEMTFEDNKLVQIIAALCAMPDVLLLDEPGNFLSRGICREVMECVHRAVQKGMTALVAAENYEDVWGYCTQYAYIKDGKIWKTGTDAHAPRCKIVTARGGSQSCLTDNMELIAGTGTDRCSYIYKDDMHRLAQIMEQAACDDWTVESMTLREELEQDVSRWEC